MGKKLTVTTGRNETNPLVEERPIRLENLEGIHGKAGVSKGPSKVGRILKEI